MDNRKDQIWAQNESKLWAEIAALTHGTIANRIALGLRFHDLRSLYSDRNSGGHRLTSSHGAFEEEIRKRGFKPRTVRGWIEDWEAALAGRPLSAAKHKARRERSRPATATSTLDPQMASLADFASLLPAARTAYLLAAKVLHPDCGGDTTRMQRLNESWARAKNYYEREAVSTMS